MLEEVNSGTMDVVGGQSMCEGGSNDNSHWGDRNN